jgi:hypothetical protein
MFSQLLGKTFTEVYDIIKFQGKRYQGRSKKKRLLAVFFYQDGVVHCEFALGHTKEYYLQVLRRLCDAIRR